MSGKNFFAKCFQSIGVLFIFNASVVSAQINMQVHGTYLHAPAWDQTFQQYNFARPWNEKKLRPWQYGAAAGVGYSFIFSERGQVYLNPTFGAARWYTHSANTASETFVSLYQFHFALNARLSPKALMGRMNTGPLGPRYFIEAAPMLSGFLPRVYFNDEAWQYSEDEPYRPLSLAFGAKLGVGFHFFNVGRFLFTPVAGACWYPTVELEEFAEALQGANMNGLKNEARNVLVGYFGIQCHLIPRDKSWWNRPGGKGD